MRNGILDRDEKARAVMAARGRPGNDIQRFNDAELDQLAALYDAHLHPQTLLTDNFNRFFAAHSERCEAAKAVVGDEPRPSFARNKRSVAKAKAALPAVAAPPEASKEAIGAAKAEPPAKAAEPMTPND